MKRGSTLIETMVGLALLGISLFPLMTSVTDYRSRVIAVRHAYAAVECLQAEVERLRAQSPDSVRTAVGVVTPPTETCRSLSRVPRLRLSAAGGGVFVLTAQIASSRRSISLPFLPIGGGAR